MTALQFQNKQEITHIFQELEQLFLKKSVLFMVMLEEAATWWLGRVIAFIALCVITGMRGNSFSAPTIK